MRFRRPFDLTQRVAASNWYRQCRQYIRDIEAHYPAGTQAEEDLLRGYRRLVREFAHELQNPDAKINVERLNRLQQEALDNAMEYNILAQTARFVMRAIERLITPDVSRGVVRYLRSRKWADARIARTIAASSDFVRRVASGIQSFSDRDITSLARASDVSPMRLLFEGLGRTTMNAEQRGLFEATRDLLNATDGSGSSVAVKPPKKRRAGKRAA